ncbi:MAG: class I SAM-dependent methyltransferase [Candidatus Taylorbacteria bacterium]
MKDKNTSWGAIAEWYDGLVEDTADSYQKNVLMPNLIRLVDPKVGMAVLDVACGQGYFARAFANNGAKVIGCDISSELIELAKKHVSNDTIKKGSVVYNVTPSDKLTFVPDGSIDVVVIILALQNIEKILETFQECSRTLKVGGRMIVVLNHPAFRVPKYSSWRWDDARNLRPEISGVQQAKMYRRIDEYMSEAQIKVDMTPGENIAAKKKFTVSFHRPLQSYFKALNKSGLAVTRLEEWISHKKSQVGPRSAEEDRTRKEIPMFLMIESRKF